MAWFSQQVPGVRSLFNRMFSPEWMHILMHAFLYGVLSISAAVIFRGHTQRRWLALLVVFSVGVIQEGVQNLAAGRIPGLHELFDLSVDLAGGSLGFWLYAIFSRSGFADPSRFKKHNRQA